jgi:hypothetical protein
MFEDHYHQLNMDEVERDLQAIDCPKSEWNGIEEKVDHTQY